MNTSQSPAGSAEVTAAICHELLLLARDEEVLAADEASRTPYWSATPPTVLGHRAAAAALLAKMHRLEALLLAQQWLAAR
ncbi:hypothetical protein DDE18_21840 [Nocardioides gansuensis]|uniref:Uncharacterized protein n=1 Tax=Nocardioides gansuensis TaxID=2138300 RepID=A0A2T8F4R3_9ACTN|nr:hypothetical protein [Nocardioides gansuensis]PVG80711.1 hypothetical protein DDE18_21840 [Nocardioides gansuensis]